MPCKHPRTIHFKLFAFHKFNPPSKKWNLICVLSFSITEPALITRVFDAVHQHKSNFHGIKLSIIMNRWWVTIWFLFSIYIIFNKSDTTIKKKKKSIYKKYKISRQKKNTFTFTLFMEIIIGNKKIIHKNLFVDSFFL